MTDDLLKNLRLPENSDAHAMLNGTMRQAIDRDEMARLAKEAQAAHARIAREDASEFASYVLRDEQTRKKLIQNWHHEEWIRLREKHDRLMLIAAVEQGKALALDTPVLTTQGWSTMGQVQVGDEVYDQHGKPTRVTFKSPVFLENDCYRVTWSDGETVVADADHRWVVVPEKPGPSGVRFPQELAEATVMTTREMYKAGGSEALWGTPVGTPIERPAQDFPVDPYVMGVWLVSSIDGGSFLRCGDRWVLEEVGRREGMGKIVATSKTSWTGTFGPQAKGTSYEMSGRRRVASFTENKTPLEIVRELMLGSIAQRRDVLAGMLDARGDTKGAGVVRLDTDRPELTDAFRELAWSLGHACPKPCEDDTPVSLYTTERVFYLESKHRTHQKHIELIGPWVEHPWRSICLIEPVESVPTQCISVASPTKTFRCTRTHVVTGNTVQFSAAAPLFLLGRNPNLRIAIISKTEKQALKIVRMVADYISGRVGPELHHVFPNLRPGNKWTDTQLFVERDPGIREPSLQAIGYGGAIMGSRIDVVILDDVLDSKNTQTQAQRDSVWQWYLKDVDNRVTADGKVWGIGNAWNPKDLYHTFEAHGWPTYRFPVSIDQQLIDRYPHLKGQLGEPMWPQRWSKERIHKKRHGPPPLPPIEFARAYMCVARDDADARFKHEWIAKCLEAGDGLMHYHDIDHYGDARFPVGHEGDDTAIEDLVAVYHGVDLSTGREEGDLTVVFTIGVYKGRDKRREVLNVESGRWQIVEIAERIIAIWKRYGGVFLVENNAAQDYVVQILGNTNVPVFPYTTGKSKADPTHGVEVLAGEMANGRWVIPSKQGQPMSPEVEAWIAEMIDYSPNPKVHTGDRLMASWFARTLAYRYEVMEEDDEDEGASGSGSGLFFGI